MPRPSAVSFKVRSNISQSTRSACPPCHSRYDKSVFLRDHRRPRHVTQPLALLSGKGAYPYSVWGGYPYPVWEIPLFCLGDTPILSGGVPLSCPGVPQSCLGRGGTLARTRGTPTPTPTVNKHLWKHYLPSFKGWGMPRLLLACVSPNLHPQSIGPGWPTHQHKMNLQNLAIPKSWRQVLNSNLVIFQLPIGAIWFQYYG